MGLGFRAYRYLRNLLFYHGHDIGYLVLPVTDFEILRKQPDLHHHHQCAFTRYVYRHFGSFEGLDRLVQVDVQQGHIRTCYCAGAKVDPGGDELYFHPDGTAIGLEPLFGDMQLAVFAEYKPATEVLREAGVAIKAEFGEACVIIPSRAQDVAVEAVYEYAIGLDVDFRSESVPDKGAFPAGRTEPFGSAAGVSRLPYGFGHRTQAVLTIAYVRNDVAQPAFKWNDRI